MMLFVLFISVQFHFKCCFTQELNGTDIDYKGGNSNASSSMAGNNIHRNLPSFGKTDPINFDSTEPEIKLPANIEYLTTASKLDEFNIDKTPEIDEGLCQMYRGLQCAKYLRNQSVYIPTDLTQNILEDKLTAAFRVISYSKDLSSNCEVFALPSLCYSTFPICRTPDITNALYFQGKSKSTVRPPSTESKIVKKEEKYKNRKNIEATTEKLNIYFQGVTPNMKPENANIFTEATDNLRKRHSPTFDVHIDTKTKFVKNENFVTNFEKFAPLTSKPSAVSQSGLLAMRNSVSLRRICRQDCEILENELCQKEYSIAKRHPNIGQQLTLEECVNLPDISTDCLELGLKADLSPDERCYWENGSSYRGLAQVTIGGRTCVKWAHQMVHKLANYPDLAGGHNYCRNPGGAEMQPWCFVEYSSKMEKEFCDIPKCSQKLWFYIIVGIVSLVILIIFTLACVWCTKHRQKSSTANIQNINLPNADKNIYGNSRLNSPIEMTSLLPTVASLSGAARGCTSRGSALRVPQYTLQDVRFIEELGEGAFGKVYKGELDQVSGGSLFVAVKALKENASQKTQSDFRREIELISDLRHDNIVCILGVVLKQEPLCMLFEYMTQGDLHEFLILNSPSEGKSLTQVQFLQISMQISDGMEYLAGHHYVHRDLAARNCLVGDNLTVKISDFGLSRDIYSSDYYRVQSKSLLPVRWMPPESILYGKFTTESDVWSYGVVLWEIYSYGLQPYYGYSNQEVISMVRARQLLPCPEVCPGSTYSLMVECWHEQAVRRPSFPEIGHRLKVWHQSQRREQADNASSCSSSRISKSSFGNKTQSTNLSDHERNMNHNRSLDRSQYVEKMNQQANSDRTNLHHQSLDRNNIHNRLQPRNRHYNFTSSHSSIDHLDGAPSHRKLSTGNGVKLNDSQLSVSTSEQCCNIPINKNIGTKQKDTIIRISQTAITSHPQNI